MIENLQKEGAQHLARDGLAPKREENKSAIQQMLKQFMENNKRCKLDSKGTIKRCLFRCHKQGHWTIDYPEGHEPEYPAKQNCYLCVKKGNFKVACPNKIKTDDQFKTKRKQIKPPVVKSACYQTGTLLVKLFGKIVSENSSNHDSKFH